MLSFKRAVVHFSCISTGEDYEFPDIIRLTFEPEVQRIPVPVEILSDSIPEETENFQIFLSLNETKRGLTPGENFTATIFIMDDDSKLCYSV